MSGPNHDREDTETGALAGSSSGEQTSTSIGGMKRSDSTQNPYMLFAKRKLQTSRVTPKTASPNKHTEKTPLSNRNSLLGQTPHGLHQQRAKTAKELLEILMGRAHQVGPAMKEVIFQIIFKILSHDDNKHLRNYRSKTYGDCSPLDIALKNNKMGQLDDQIWKLIGIGCNYFDPSNKHLLPKKPNLPVDIGLENIAETPTIRMRNRR